MVLKNRRVLLSSIAIVLTLIVSAIFVNFTLPCPRNAIEPVPTPEEKEKFKAAQKAAAERKAAAAKAAAEASAAEAPKAE